MTAREDKEKEKTRRENLSKFVYQLAHTCFTAMVIVAAVALVLDVDKPGSYALLLGLGVFCYTFFSFICRQYIKKEIIMEGIYIIFAGIGIVALALYLWSSYTKSGRKWLESL